jgi:hypothetical protein
MDTLGEMTAADVPLTIGGTTYRLSMLRAKDWAEAARYLNSQRTGAIEIVKARLAGLSELAQKHLLELAYREERDGDLLPLENLERWFATPVGSVYRFWLMLRRNHPEISLERAEELIELAGREASARKTIESREGLGLPLGNSPGLPTGQAGQIQATEPTAPGGRSPGGGSSAS